MFTLILLALSAAPQTVTLTPVDGKCISSASHDDWNDNRFRAYWSSASQGYVDGLVKFDFSGIPDGATILSMTLRAYHEAGFGNPYNSPEVVVFRSSGDSWARGQNDVHPGFDQALTLPQTNFPANDLVPVDFALDVGAANWAQDLADNVLTLGLRNVAGAVGRYSYVYFYSSDPLPAPPELTITYSAGPVLTVQNLIAGGTASFTVSNATPGANAGVALSRTGGGPTTVGAGSCGPQTISLSLPVYVLGVQQTNGAGTATIYVNVPAGAAGMQVWCQGLDMAACELTNGFAGTVG